ncbi:hypothetical protein DTO166G4_4808 [Paecilomyces variotii]|nr:hypothetical protein DTO166G4_4808 [Paecilomyces variotii]KAJ9240509.1 hypothetical protein DTO166G5_1847 [Paecilomyces variotii]
MGSSPELVDADFSSIPRSREENQERAFVAASRRKDRSLDARLESAHRASMLHKKRTGKALYITREIVEKEAMYEEVDERYQEKRLRMLQAQNMQIEEQFQRQLLAAFAAGANSAARSRHSIAVPQAPSDGVKKTRIDLPATRASFSEGGSAGSVPSPMPASQDHVGTPTITYPQTPGTPSYVQTPGSYVQTPGGYSNGFPSPQMPQYLTQQNSWRQQPFNLFPRRQQGYPAAQQNDVQTVDSWRRRVLMQSLENESPTQTQGFRSRLASAPEPQLRAQLPIAVPPSPVQSPWAQSEPSSDAPEESHNTMSQPLTMATVTPQQTYVTPQAWGTPDLCPSPGSLNSASNTSWDDSIPPEMVAHDSTPLAPLMVSTDQLDPDFADFNRFALGLESSSHYQDGFGLETSAFDDWVALDLDFAAAA